MIELESNQLVVSFPEVHERARLRIDFQRTLRIPDDNREYPLPAGLGRFPLDHTEDFSDTVPDDWVRRGGVILPMYQSEALWINLNSRSSRYPCAVKIAAGKINAVTGKAWSNELEDDPQDYLVTPRQPWLDGFSVAKGRIRQFVAMPLGEGFTAEEQITDRAEVGGLQIIVYPMKREKYQELMDSLGDRGAVRFRLGEPSIDAQKGLADMGLAAGGLMRQEIYEDDYGIDAWDTEHCSRCFVHIANSEQYAEITGKAPPHAPPTSEQYEKAGIPWFDYYAGDLDALDGSSVLAGLDSVEARRIKQGLAPDEGNKPVRPKRVVTLEGSDRRVNEGQF